MIRIITATAVSVLMATGALAQATTTFDATQSAVFKDEKGTLRTSTEAKTRFEALPADQQTAIRTACTQYKAASGSGGSTDTTTTGSTTTTTSDAMMVGAADMTQVCGMVETF
jgi:rubredoxin